VKITIIAGMAAATLCGAFVCLPIVRGQNGPTAGRAVKSPAKSSPAAAAGSSAALKIACLDMGLIIREYRKMADKQQELKAINDLANAKISQINGEMAALAKPVQEGKIDRESEEYGAREKKLYQLDNARKACKATGERDMKLQSVKIMSAIYKDAQAALKLFSEQNGYTLVIQVDREAAKTQDYRMIQNVAGQLVIYHRSQDDITLRVLSYLNNQYETERAEAGIEETSSSDQSDDLPTRTIPASPNRKRTTP
jgi:Skp family chaperone for outer membrane proteins